MIWPETEDWRHLASSVLNFCILFSCIFQVAPQKLPLVLKHDMNRQSFIIHAKILSFTNELSGLVLNVRCPWKPSKQPTSMISPLIPLLSDHPLVTSLSQGHSLLVYPLTDHPGFWFHCLINSQTTLLSGYYFLQYVRKYIDISSFYLWYGSNCKTGQRDSADNVYELKRSSRHLVGPPVHSFPTPVSGEIPAYPPSSHFLISSTPTSTFILFFSYSFPFSYSSY